LPDQVRQECLPYDLACPDYYGKVGNDAGFSSCECVEAHEGGRQWRETIIRRNFYGAGAGSCAAAVCGPLRPARVTREPAA